MPSPRHADTDAARPAAELSLSASPGPRSARRAILLPVTVLLSLHASALPAQQRANPDFDPTVSNPAYAPGEGPRILFDDAHDNFHTSDGRYEPFVRLMTADGFRLASNRAPFSAESLAGHDILVISSARGAPLGEPGQADPAFTAEEADVVRDWVRDGGALLLITDHPPAATPPRPLAERFGITLVDATPRDTVHFWEHPGQLVFSRPHGTLRDHAITRGRDPGERVQRVITFAGNSIIPPPEASVLLRLAATAVEGYNRDPAGDTMVNVVVPATGAAQGIALTHGRGRVVALGEAAAWSSQVFGDGHEVTGMDAPGFDNRQFILNVMRWLGGLLPESVMASPAPDTDFDPAIARATFERDGPRVLFDAGHHSLFTIDGRFGPLAALLASDGYEPAAVDGPLARASLADADVLVIAGPRAAPVDCAGVAHAFGSEDCAAARSAFAPDEIEEIEGWVREGGALLLALDAFPSAAAGRELARAFDVHVAGGYALDWIHRVGPGIAWITFAVDSGTVMEHPITRDVSRAVLFGSTSLAAPDAGTALLLFASPAIEELPARLRADTMEIRRVPIAGRAAAVALPWGSGRVVILGDAELLTSQRFDWHDGPVGLDAPPGHDNRRFALNLFRWLSRRP
jgi:uncharacterized membrane protein